MSAILRIAVLRAAVLVLRIRIAALVLTVCFIRTIVPCVLGIILCLIVGHKGYLLKFHLAEYHSALLLSMASLFHFIHNSSDTFPIMLFIEKSL